MHQRTYFAFRMTVFTKSNNPQVSKLFKDDNSVPVIHSYNLFCLLVFPSKLAAHFQSMEVRNSNFAAFIETFTSNTYCMVIMSDTSIREQMLLNHNCLATPQKANWNMYRNLQFLQGKGLRRTNVIVSVNGLILH